jgi:hypothetical protein
MDDLDALLAQRAATLPAQSAQRGYVYSEGPLTPEEQAKYVNAPRIETNGVASTDPQADDIDNLLSARASGKELLPPQKETSFIGDVKQGVGNIAAGAVRGAGSIGATILAPYDMVKDAMAGKGLSLESNRQRRADMDAGLQTMGAEPDSMLFKGGKLAGEVAGTAGMGGLVANGLRLVPGLSTAAPRLISSIESGGFSTGAPAATTISGKIADAGIRAAGGGINGLLSVGAVNPEDAATGGLLGAALPGAVKATGLLADGVGNVATNAAEKLMQSAVKPTIQQLKSGDAATAVRTLLDYGVNPTKAGVEKIRGLINDINTQIADKISNSGANISKQAVVGRLGDVEQRFSNQVAPTSDLAAIRNVADEFMNHPSYPGADIPVQAAQSMKQGTYKILAGKYGEAGSATTEAQKGLARGLKEEIAQAVPGVQGLNAEESRLISTLSVAERRALMEMNKNPMGLAALASSPLSWAAFMADRSAAFKALAARAINRAANATPNVSLMLQGAANNPLIRNSAIAIGADE